MANKARINSNSTISTTTRTLTAAISTTPTAKLSA